MAAVGLDLDAFADLWPAVIESIQQERPLLAEHLKVARPTALGDGELTLAWAETAGLSKRKAEDAANRELIGRAIRAVTGASLRLAHELARRAAPRPRPPTLSPDELVERFVEEFEAEILPEPRRRPDAAPAQHARRCSSRSRRCRQEMMAAQESLKDEHVEASAGGGMVTVVATGDLAIESITIDPDAVDPEDVEMLQDTVLAAVNEALRSAQELRRRQDGRRDRRPGRPRRPGRAGPARPLSRLLAPPLQRLVTELGKLPGIGNRTAQRLAFHILRTSKEDAAALADAIRDVKEKITLCEICFNLAEGPRCAICADERRDPALICVVEEPGDVIPIERTHEYRGRYHVLGGALSPIDGVEPDDLKIAQLYARIEGAEVREVVLATNPTTTGEATALHIADGLRERAPDVAVTRLASGLPVGGDLEYADEVTLGRALAGRRAL